MLDTLEKREKARCSFECWGAISAAATFGLIFSFLVDASWQHSLILMVMLSLLGGGIAFSFGEMSRHADWSAELKRIIELESFDAELEALNAKLVAQRAKVEREIGESPEGIEPYRHHEDHEESPGPDQGQLTSRLPGTTPWFGQLWHGQAR